MRTVLETARETPVVREVDVVAGGGVSGCTAAISAVRLGVRTLPIERYGYLGGVVSGWPEPAFYTFGGPDRQDVCGGGGRRVGGA